METTTLTLFTDTYDATNTLPTDMTTNCTCPMNQTLNAETAPLSYTALIVWTLACILVFLLNAGVIFIVLSQKKLRNEASLTYCVSLSAADLLLAVNYMLNMTVMVKEIQIPLVCTIAKNLTLVCGMLSAGSVTLLVIHRYVSVRLPILHRKSHTLTVSVCLCGTMWILCTLIQFLPYAMQQNKSGYEQCQLDTAYWKGVPSVKLQLIIIGSTLLGLIVLLHMLTFLEVKRLYRKITPKDLREKNNRRRRSLMSRTFNTEVTHGAANNLENQDSQQTSGDRFKVKRSISAETQGKITKKTSIPMTDVPKNSLTRRNDTREMDIKILTGVSKTAKVTTFLIIALLVFNVPLLVHLIFAQLDYKTFAGEDTFIRVGVLLHFMNALANPIIYAGNQVQIRKHIIQTVPRLNCRRGQ